MPEAFVVDNADANNFVVRRIASSDRYVFQVVPVDAQRRVLGPAAWAKGANLSSFGHADCFLHEAEAFARRAAFGLGLIK